MKRPVRTGSSNTPRSTEAKAAQAGPAAPTPEQIQKRAYEIFQSRGGAPGDEWRDWFLAETQLKAELGLVPPAHPAGGDSRR